MNNIELAKLLSILAKCKIENNPYISKEEKEVYKTIVDKAKEEIVKNNTNSNWFIERIRGW